MTQNVRENVCIAQRFLQLERNKTCCERWQKTKVTMSYWGGTNKEDWLGLKMKNLIKPYCLFLHDSSCSCLTFFAYVPGALLPTRSANKMHASLNWKRKSRRKELRTNCWWRNTSGLTCRFVGRVVTSWNCLMLLESSWIHCVLFLYYNNRWNNSRQTWTLSELHYRKWRALSWR